MAITLEQARTLDAVVRCGSFAKAAAELHKAHSAIVYQLKTMEDTAGVPLFDRSGYRTRLTALGERVHEQCLKLLAAEEDLDALVRSAKAGFEPWVKIVFDGLMPIAPILESARAVTAAAPTTKVQLFCAFLSGVDLISERETADVVIALLPPAKPFPYTQPLAPITSLLVTHRGHPLARVKGRITLEELQQHTFLTVHGSDQRLRMSTSTLDKATTFHLSDFHAKKYALMQGIGYGWMPEYLIESELAARQLVVLDWGAAARHTFRPLLHWHGAARAGRAAQAFVAKLTGRGED